VGSVIGQRHAQQIRYLLPEVVIAKAIDEVLKQRERQKQPTPSVSRPER
jgi:hypothetical protein